jgi:hypothetical protein
VRHWGEIKSLGKVAASGGALISARARASDVSVYDNAVEIHKIEAENKGIHFSLLFTTVDYTKNQYEARWNRWSRARCWR